MQSDQVKVNKFPHVGYRHISSGVDFTFVWIPGYPKNDVNSPP